MLSRLHGCNTFSYVFQQPGHPMLSSGMDPTRPPGPPSMGPRMTPPRGPGPMGPGGPMGPYGPMRGPPPPGPMPPMGGPGGRPPWPPSSAVGYLIFQPRCIENYMFILNTIVECSLFFEFNYFSLIYPAWNVTSLWRRSPRWWSSRTRFEHSDHAQPTRFKHLIWRQYVSDDETNISYVRSK